MKIHFELSEPAGPVVAAGDYPTHTAFLVSLANLGHVIRLLRAGNVVPQVGQKLTIWIDADAGPA
jgi:hypothetical protein